MADSQALTYAALILSDAGKEVTAEALVATAQAAGIEVRPSMAALYSRFLQKHSIASLVSKAASSGATASAPAAAPAAGASAGAAPAAASKKEDKKPAKAAEPEEEDDFGMGGLF